MKSVKGHVRKKENTLDQVTQVFTTVCKARKLVKWSPPQPKWREIEKEREKKFFLSFFFPFLSPATFNSINVSVCMCVCVIVSE